MKERRKIGEKEKELLPYLADYVKRNHLEKEDGLAIALLCNTDEKSEIMIDILRKTPDIEFDELLERAIEIHKNN